MYKFSVIIPAHNKWNLVEQRLLELVRFEPPLHEIVIVDDASPENFSRLAWWYSTFADRGVRLEYTKNDVNQGFGYSMNKGAEWSTGDVLVFLSNDVIVGNDFRPEITSKLRLRLSPEGVPMTLFGGEYLTHDTGWNTIEGTIIPYLNGWFLACHRDTWKILGGFDPRYGLSDYEDIDLGITAYVNNIMLIPLREANLHHLGGQSFGYNPTREARTKANREKFTEKWREYVRSMKNDG